MLDVTAVIVVLLIQSTILLATRARRRPRPGQHRPLGRLGEGAPQNNVATVATITPYAGEYRFDHGTRDAFGRTLEEIAYSAGQLAKKEESR